MTYWNLTVDDKQCEAAHDTKGEVDTTLSSHTNVYIINAPTRVETWLRPCYRSSPITTRQKIYMFTVTWPTLIFLPILSVFSLFYIRGKKIKYTFVIIKRWLFLKWRRILANKQAHKQTNKQLSKKSWRLILCYPKTDNNWSFYRKHTTFSFCGPTLKTTTGKATDPARVRLRAAKYNKR